MGLVVILARRTHYMSVLYAVRALGRRGKLVDVVLTGTHGSPELAEIAKASRYIKDSYVLSCPDDELPGRLADMYRDMTEPPVLFPAGDVEVNIIDRHRDELARYFKLASLNEGQPGDMTLLMDKMQQLERAASFGLRIPRQLVVDLRDFEEVPEGVVYPCFCKPLKSIDGSKTEMCRCDGPEELRVKLLERKKTDPNRSFLVQKFMDIDYECAMTGACMDQSVYIAGVSKKLSVANYTKGVTVLGEIIDIDDVGQEMVSGIEALLRSYHYTGMFDIDLMVCGGQYYFNEVNFRISGIDYAFTQSGSNSSNVLVSYLEKGTAEGEADGQAVPGAVFFNDRCAWEDRLRGFITDKEFEDMKAAADYSLINSPDDPIPGKLFEKYYRKRMFRSKLKSVLSLGK